MQQKNTQKNTAQIITSNIFLRVFGTVFFIACAIMFFVGDAHAATVTGTSGNILKNGLVGHWTFDGKNMTNATATDSSGSGNQGGLVNMTASTSKAIGKIGQGLNFTSSTTKVFVPDNASLDVQTGSFTLTAWVNQKGASVCCGGDPYQPIVGKGRSSGSTYTYMLTSHDAGNLIFTLFDGINNPAVSTGAGVIPVNTWKFVVGQYNGTLLSLYVDGVLVATSTRGSYTTAADTTDGVYIGEWPRDAAARGHFNGIIDDVRIYNRALSASEIKALYKLGGGTVQYVAPKSGLAAHWTFDNDTMTTNTTVRDISGNNNTGTLTGMTATSSQVQGKINKALSFHASRNVQVSDSASLDITNTLTLSAWVYATATPIAGEYHTVIAKGSAAAAVFNYRMSLYGASGAIPYISFSFKPDSTTHSVRGSTVLTANRWYHFVVVYDDAADSIKMYVDNVLQTNTTVLGSPTATSITVNSAPLSIGVQDAGNSGQYHGFIDDVRVYNKVLSTQEITGLYTTGLKSLVSVKSAASPNPVASNTGINSGLVGYWTFDGKHMTNATATDSSGSGNNGTLNNLPASTRVPGKIGQGLNINNGTTSDYINIPYNASLDIPTSGGAIMSWFKLDRTTSSNSALYTIYRWRYHPNTANTGGIDFGVYSIVGQPYHFAMYHGDSEVLVRATSTQIVKGKWYHGVATWDGTTVRMYLDGVEIRNVPQTATMSWGNNAGGCIGRACSAPGTGFGFEGSIDDVRVYNRYVTPQEVQALYKLGA